MFLALIVATLGIVIAVSAWKPRLHAGTLALAATLVLGTTVGGLSAERTLAFFPQSLFLTLFGVTLFSSFLDRAGLLAFAVQATVAKLPRHRGRLATATFFIIAAVTALGLGNIAAVALVAPLAMALARERGISFPAMSVVVIGGANAAAFSPLALAGILVGTYVTKHDLNSRAGLSLEVLMLSLAGGAFVVMAFISFLGYRFFSARHKGTREQPRAPLEVATEPASPPEPTEASAVLQKTLPPLQPPVQGNLHAKKRLGLLVCVFVGALAFRVPLAVAGWSAAAAALVLTHVKLDDALKRVPFSSLLLVCGMSMLVALAESRDLGSLLAGFTSGNVNLKASPGVLSFLAGTLSAFSSSTGVVLPLFLPIVDAFSETTHVEGGGFVAMLVALMAGTHVVDTSPFSTLGALCIAACPPGAAREGTFRALLIWGLVMIPVAGLLGLAAGSFL